MLIIFDLDDTLIDTSGCITPVQLKLALETVSNKGLQLPKLEDSLSLLLRLNETAPSAKHALEEFFEINAFDVNYLPLAIKTVYDDLPDSFTVEPMDMAADILAVLSESHKLALVTVGKFELQVLKLKKAGIHSEIFSKIIVTQERDKKIHYKSILSELDMEPSEVIVCGDRIAIDLTPAKELGLTTVQMRSGRGLHCKGSKSDVDFTISHLSEITEILPKMSNITSLMGNS